MQFSKGRIKSGMVKVRKLVLAVDTALSWDGVFPDPGPGDYLVTIHVKGKGGRQVLVSRRYVSAVDEDNAASIAEDAFNEFTGEGGSVVSVDRVID